MSCPVRLEILRYLEDPEVHFPPQVYGNLAHDGVCAGHIQQKIGIAPATASRHLGLLAAAGLVIPTRRKGFTFYRRDEKAVQAFLARFQSQLLRTRRGM